MHREINVVKFLAFYNRPFFFIVKEIFSGATRTISLKKTTMIGERKERRIRYGPMSMYSTIRSKSFRLRGYPEGVCGNTHRLII